jgi:hypothetical protein
LLAPYARCAPSALHRSGACERVDTVYRFAQRLRQFEARTQITVPQYAHRPAAAGPGAVRIPAYYAPRPASLNWISVSQNKRRRITTRITQAIELETRL